jgi:hypothetical protein
LLPASRVLALAVVVPLAVGLTACTGGDDQAQPTPSPTLQGRFATASDLGAALQEAALAAGTATGRVDVRGPDGTARGTAAYRFDSQGTDLTARAAVTGRFDAEVALVLLDDVLYVRVPQAYRFLVSTPWVQTPADTTGAEVLGPLAAQATVPGGDLVQAGNDAALTYLGERETASGPAEVYRVEQGRQVSTYWVGEDDLLGRVERLSPDGTTGTATYRDWGADVSIEAPPADEVGDLPF